MTENKELSLYDKAQAMKCREKTSWHGEYDGVAWEIMRFPDFDLRMVRKFSWTFYLYIFIDRIPKEKDPESYWLNSILDGKRVHYYYSISRLADIKWHGGITFYSKESGFEGEERVIKAGCDFQHSWDYEYGELTLDQIKLEVVEAIESFRVIISDYKYWCPCDGKLHPPEEIKKIDGGAYKCECKC